MDRWQQVRNRCRCHELKLDLYDAMCLNLTHFKFYITLLVWLKLEFFYLWYKAIDSLFFEGKL
jgi:hypothetical protein